MADDRPNPDAYFMAMAYLVASRSTCARRQVGCVLVNERKHVLATGYNGVAAGMPHCRGGDCPCEASTAESGTRLEDCEAIHAEQNALLQTSDPWSIDTVYCTTVPCKGCTKEMLNTSARRIVYGESYASSGIELWNRNGRVANQVRTLDEHWIAEWMHATAWSIAGYMWRDD